MEKKCKVVMLPAEKSRLAWQGPIKKLVYESKEVDKMFHSPQHLYFTSNDEIKEGDWRYCPHKGNGIDVGNGTPKPNYGARITKGGNSCKDCRKIVASTDPSLKLPGIPQSFLQKYVDAQGNIDEIVLEWIIQFRCTRADTGWYGSCGPRSPNLLYDSQCSVGNCIDMSRLKVTTDNEVIVVDLNPHTIYTHPEENASRLDKMSDLLDKMIGIVDTSKDKELEDAASEYYNTLSRPVSVYRQTLDAYKAGYKARQEKMPNDSVELAMWCSTHEWYWSKLENIWINESTGDRTKQIYELWQQTLGK